MIPAITIHQPWATLIAIGAKRWETRSRPAPAKHIGQRIAIHAAARRPDPHVLDHGRYVVAPILDAFPGSTYGDDVRVAHRGHRLIVHGEAARRGRLSMPGTTTHALPLGAIVATATLAESLPIREPDALTIYADAMVTCTAHVLLEHPAVPASVARFEHAVDISDQLTLGHWHPDMWAWRLTDIEPLPEPIPATGRQGWWTTPDPTTTREV